MSTEITTPFDRRDPAQLYFTPVEVLEHIVKVEDFAAFVRANIINPPFAP